MCVLLSYITQDRLYKYDLLSWVISKVGMQEYTGGPRLVRILGF